MNVYTALGLDVGLWSETLNTDIEPNRPALFLDRDGVVVEEVHFLKRRQDVRLYDDVATAIAEANAARLPVVVVTNQSGIARSHFGWDEFSEVQAEIVSQLAAAGARLDAVLACAYHEDGKPPFNIDHEWRKPAPGMLLHARKLLGVDLSRSVVVGDRISDLEAGRNTGLRAGVLALSGYGRENVGALAKRRAEWAGAGYLTTSIEQPAEAIRTALRFMSAD